MKDEATPNSSIKPIFLAALRLSDPQARQKYLDQACGEDIEARRKVEKLLAAREPGAANPLDQAVEQFQPGQTSPEGTANGESIDISSHPMIGPYKLLEQLGEGGMGTVFMAQQTAPIKRKVALKLINPGMDSKQVIARFEAERQALALMDHPNIAHVLDAGTTDHGRPYFVMELVKGVQITEYCENEKLSTENRLQLFEDVCRGVQHAHQKGVIHRDLKPSNLLVTRHDGRPVVKIIDFGVAKAINQELTERTLFTQYSQLIGTPLYMSPEQADLKGLNVDTRSDVYSLGVLLYELLTGTTPFDRETLRQAGFDEMRRIIREEEPPTPSSRLSTLTAEQSDTISEQRGTDTRRLTRVVRGELDWIVMKAMEKDRTRRYESASMLADDVQRYLEGEAVEACPESAVYRFKKLARHNKATLTTMAFVAIALILGTIVSLWQAQKAWKQRDLARDNESFARQLVYASDVRLAAQAWEDGDVRHYADLLNRHEQSSSGEDLRGFEWRYLLQLGTVKPHTISEAAVGVCSVRYSPDGKFIAAGRYDGTIEVIDGRDYRQLAMLSGHVDLVRGIDFSPDSKRLVSIGYGGVIRIWDLKSFREIRSIQAFENVHGYRVCFAMDGQAVIAIAENSPAKMWNVDSGELIDSFGANVNGSWGLAVSPDGQSCVVRESRDDFRIWDLSPRKSVALMRFPLPQERANCLRYSPDGEFIATGTNKDFIHLYEARTGRLIATFAGHDDGILDVAFHPSGTMLASCDSGGIIRTWHLVDGAESSDANEFERWLPSFHGHALRAWSVDFSPDGKRLVSVSKDGTVLSWASRTHLPQELDVTESVASEFSPSSNDLFIVGQHKIARWDRLTNSIHPFGDSFQEEAKSLAVSPNGAIIATGHNDGTVRFWNRKTEQIVKSLHGHEDNVKQIAFSADGTLMVTASWDGTASLWDVATGKQRHVIEVPPHCHDAAFSPDGQTFAISSENNAMLYEVASGRRLHILEGHQSTARCVAFSPDGRWLATGSSDRTIRIWDIQTGQTRHVIAAHREGIFSIAFSPNGRTIATGDERGTIAFSHVATGRLLFDTKLASERINHLSFSPDGKTLAATCLWNQVVLLHTPGLLTFDQEDYSQTLMVDAENGGVGNGMIPQDEIAWVGFNQHERLTATHVNFGYSVSISGDTAIVSAPHLANTTGEDAGTAYVFVNRGGKWIVQQKLTASVAAIDDRFIEDRFGISVSVDGDTALVGANYDSSGHLKRCGAAYIFTRADGVWSESQKLTASGGKHHDKFGNSVSLCGNTAIIGSRYDDNRGRNSGSAYIFTQRDGVWREQKKLTLSDGFQDDNFGHSVSISGDTAVVGAWLRDDEVNGVNSGAVSVFTRRGGEWSHTNWLLANDGGIGDKFGCSVSVSGDTLIVGAYLHDEVGTDSGKAYIFTRSSSGWTEQQIIPSDAAAGDRFGHSVSVSGNTAIVGAWGSDASSANSGSAYVFSRQGEQWIEQQKLTASDITAGEFGFAVSVNGSTAIVGSHSSKADQPGAAHVFE